MTRASGSTATPYPRHLILGTAGHVDHGKTELVRALTGRDTDRLKEEKERGISIELGFAPLPLDALAECTLPPPSMGICSSKNVP